METHLAPFIAGTRDGAEAEAVLRKCVHCGFCTATCPTYQLLGDELDGPRGRIYLIKQVLEGEPATSSTQLHLDRCLTCLNCESTCPSGVEYGRLVEIGRRLVNDQVNNGRPLQQQVMRMALREGASRPLIFGTALKLGQAVRPLLPAALKNKVPQAMPATPWPTTKHARQMIVLAGCVQPSMSPNINAATARVLDRLGITLRSINGAGCCGALRLHLDDEKGAIEQAKRNVDAWWPHVESSEAIVMTASGCGSTVKDYGHLLRDEPQYSQKAQTIAQKTRDLSEILQSLPLETLNVSARADGPLAYHPPCSLQHGQKVRGVVESIMTRLGFDVRLCADSHLCCGSAGSYSVLQPEISQRLRDDKLRKLEATGAQAIVSANIGCISHLQTGTGMPVSHWIETIDAALAN